MKRTQIQLMRCGAIDRVSRMIKTHRNLAALLCALAITSPLHAQTFTKPNTNVSVYVAGPSWLHAGSDIPARFILIWAPVPNAVHYRIFRSWDGVSFVQQPAATTAVDPNTGGVKGSYMATFEDSVTYYYFHTKAVFADGSYSGPSPTQQARQVPDRAPTGLTYALKPSQFKLGLLRLELSWNAALPGASGYGVTLFVKDRLVNEIPTQQTSVVIDNFTPGSFETNSLSYELKLGQTFWACVHINWPTAASKSPSACTPKLK